VPDRRPARGCAWRRSLIIPEADIAEGLKRLDAACAELTALPKAANK
jgi:hypothetical protein